MISSCTNPNMENLILASEIRKDLEHHYVTYAKYVRVNGEYRFAFDAEWNTPKHSQMVQADEIAESAGSFKVYKEPARFEWEDSYSSTLNIGMLPDDEANIMKLIFGQ